MATSISAQRGSERKSSFKTNVSKDSGEVLGKLLVKDGQVTRSQLSAAEDLQKKLPQTMPIGMLFIHLQYIDEDSLIKFVSRHL
ncbi:MAG: hypothetical protein ACN4E2_05460, partial [Nitrospinota bacterium]